MFFGDRADIEGADDILHFSDGLDGSKAGNSCSDYKDFGRGYFPGTGGGHSAIKETCVKEMNSSYEFSYQSDVYESKKKKEIFKMGSKQLTFKLIACLYSSPIPCNICL